MTNKSVKVRFAPSPTGLIHIGNARTAIVNWLHAKNQGGKFVLRFDDTDVARSKQEYADAIAEDVAWLGLSTDEIHYQSKRFDLYDTARDKLIADGRLYRCYETADELERKRRRQMATGKPPVYDRTGLNLSDEDRAKLEAEGRKPHWRFRLTDRVVNSVDLIRGDQAVDMASLSDPVLIREDGTYLYTLPSVVDDIDMGITDVIRGEDHVINTSVQIEIFEALGATPPTFAHHSLLVGADGKSLSKRIGSLSIGGMRDMGLEAMAVVSHAALLGTSESIAPYQDIQDLVKIFNISKMSRAPARFDIEEVKTLNAKLLHETPLSAVADRLAAMGVEADEDFWQAVRGNISLLSDTKQFYDMIKGDITPVIADEDKDFIKEAAALLPEGEFDAGTWKAWTTAVKEKTGRKGKGLFMPLRLALTGEAHGPELAGLLPLIGREKVLARLG